MLTGVIDFNTLYKYNLADISDPAYVDNVDKMFAVRNKPSCFTLF